jgi:hypothetical protein
MVTRKKETSALLATFETRNHLKLSIQFLSHMYIKWLDIGSCTAVRNQSVYKQIREYQNTNKDKF